MYQHRVHNVFAFIVQFIAFHSHHNLDLKRTIYFTIIATLLNLLPCTYYKHIFHTEGILLACVN